MSVQLLVDRGLEVRKQIKALETELKAIEEQLKKVGLDGEQVPLKDPEREGRRYLAKGSRMIVPVVFTADRLVQTFQAGSPIEKKIRNAAGTFFLDFFKPINAFKTKYEDGKKFRAHARSVLDKNAPAFVTTCLARDKYDVPISDSKIEWEHAEPVVGA
jgi:hypothetical protein